MALSLSPQTEATLRRLYHDQEEEGALGGVEDLHKLAHRHGYTNITLKECKLFLSNEPTYALYRRARVTYPHNKTVAWFPGHNVMADLMICLDTALENDGYKYIYVQVDVYSRFLYCFPLKDRTPESIIEALTDMKKSVPWKQTALIYWDREGAFVSKKVREFLRQNGIRAYFSRSETKSSMAERMIRYLRKKLARWFSATKSKRWLERLPHIVSAYNNRVHSVTGLRPLDTCVDPFLVAPIPEQAPSGAKAKQIGINTGDFVRISVVRDKLSKEVGGRKNMKTWSPEVFRVWRVRTSTTHPMYYLCDLRGEKVQGGFLAPELFKVHGFSPTPKVVENVYGERHVNGRQQRLVSYKNYPSSFVEWV